MPSPFEIESLLEDALVLRLAALGITATPYRSVATLTAPYVAIHAESFDIASNQRAFTPAGAPYYNHYQGTLTFMIVTPRTPAGVATHRQRLGQLRAFGTEARGGFRALVPTMEVLRVAPTGSAATIAEDRETDTTELAFTLDVGLRNGLDLTT
jgi:hypothetical protein